MSPATGRTVLLVSSIGFPLTQAAIRHLGRNGAVATEAVAVGLLARDVALIAAGAPRRLRRGPALLLRLETAVAALAAVTGLRLVADESARLRALEPKSVGAETLRRLAFGVLFGLHTARFRIYLSPGRGLRSSSGEA
jgi:hypothetical protein